MLFYQHAGYETGSADWPIQAVKIGNGWDFRQVFAGNEGAIYAITYDGDMLFYQHAGYEDGSAAWPIQAVKIGNGWNFRQVFAGDNAPSMRSPRTATCSSICMPAFATVRPIGRFRA